MTANHFEELVSAGSDASGAPVSLHDVLSRGIELHWDEAVAIVQELCAVSIAASGDAAVVPDLKDVRIGRDGTVTLWSGRGEKNPSAAGRTLHLLMVNAVVPVPLRLFVTQSTTPDAYRTLREFANGLSYFCKPGGTQLIQDVYRRYQQSPANMSAPPRPRFPLPETEPKEKAARRATRQRLVRTALAVSLGLASLGVWAWTNARPRAAIEVAAGQVASRAASAFADVKRQIREAVTPAPAALVQEPKHAPTRLSPGRPGSVVLSAVRSDVEDRDDQPVIERRELPSGTEQIELAAAAPHIVSPESRAIGGESSETNPRDDSLYSKADRDVQPPVLLFPHMTGLSVTAGTAGNRVNRMLVDVSPDGTVERVQLVEGPARMPDIMMLSGVKAWRFTPAVRNGEPVRYRTIVSWTGLP